MAISDGSGGRATIRTTVHYQGRVQGVGFRWTTRRIANEYPVTGCVANLYNGQVKLIVEGSPAEVDRFLERVRDAMFGKIEGEQRLDSEATGEFQDFAILSSSDT